jgi:hypothetical protein
MSEAKATESLRQVPNESVALYDMNADDLLEQTGHLVVDSSLGIIVDPRRTRRGDGVVTQEH